MKWPLKANDKPVVMDASVKITMPKAAQVLVALDTTGRPAGFAVVHGGGKPDVVTQIHRQLAAWLKEGNFAVLEESAEVHYQFVKFEYLLGVNDAETQ